MESALKSKKKIIVAIIIVLALLVLFAIIYFLFAKPEKISDPIPLTFENYDSIIKGSVQGYSATLNGGGYVTINLDSSEYLIHYTLKKCTNPSEKLDYSYINSEGKEVSYDPLKEKVILGNDGKKQTKELSEAEQNNAVLTERIYVVEIEGTQPKKSFSIAKAGTTTFSANGNVKFLFNSKCTDGSLTIKIYRI